MFNSMFRPPSYCYLSPYSESIEDLQLRIEIEDNKLNYDELKTIRKKLKHIYKEQSKENDQGTFLFSLIKYGDDYYDKHIKKYVDQMFKVHDDISHSLEKIEKELKDELNKFKLIADLKLCLEFKRTTKLRNVINKYRTNGWQFNKWIYDEACDLNYPLN